MSKKKLLSLALVVIMIAILSFSSLAWFSDADQVTNEFLVAGSDDADPDEIFSVDVWEDKDGDGDPDDDLPEADKEGLVYENILPGDTLMKRPYVKNTGSYDQYIRVTVTISDAKAWIAAMGPTFDVTNVFLGYNAANWTHVWNNLNGAAVIPDNIVYVMYYKDIVPVGGEINVFTDIKIPESLTQEQAAAFSDDTVPGFTIDVKADAVQTRNVVPEGTAAEDAAWAAFKTVENTVNP